MVLINQLLQNFHHPSNTEINVLRLNNEGILLAGMHDGTVILWNIGAGNTLLTYQFPQPISSALWLIREDKTAFGFAVGCVGGTLYIFGPQGNGWEGLSEYPCSELGAIEELAWDYPSRRLAAAGSGQAKIFQVTEQYRIEFIGSTPARAATPRFVAFSNQGKDLLIGYLESHELCLYQISPLTLQWSAHLPTRIGHAALTGDHKYLIVYNLAAGVDVYETPVSPGIGLSQTFPFSNSLNLLSTVSLARNGEIIVCGGPDGHMNVFNRCIGLRIASLPVGPSTAFVQTVTACTVKDRIVLAAGCKVDAQIIIKAWEYIPSSPSLSPQPPKPRVSVRRRIFQAIYHSIFVLMALVIFFEGDLRQSRVERLLEHLQYLFD